MSNLLPDYMQTWVPDLIQLAYLIASVLFILGLKRLSSPDTARTGNQMAATGMLIGVVVTLLDQQILTFEYIIAGVIIGAVAGTFIARTVPMTDMPEMVAMFNGFGGIASALVASGEYFRFSDADPGMQAVITVSLSVLIGSVTFTGSLMAYGKLSGLINGNATRFAGQRWINLGILTIIIVAAGFFAAGVDPVTAFAVLAGLSLLLGILFVLPIGGADMPVVISLLNSLSGLAASATGFVLDNNLLIISGTLVGAAGLILTMIMCKGMNRTLTDVLFGAFGGSMEAGSETDGDKTIRKVQADDVAVMTAYSKRVIIVPGYGLAVAQAQHAIREAAEHLEKKGVDVRYAIHPVAGRMPGHMNVLLAEANVPYPQLYDMEEINDEFSNTDVVLVLGANDVVNPAANNNPASPIYGMPVLNVEKAKSVVVFKRSMNPGYAGIQNDLFFNENSYMFFGDAKSSVTDLIAALKEL
ncbi:NAD(P)(+) transhydrogenase (Re/Si-specific) subunit beta [Natronogracilivirga saccharolytica]|uniref:NAD(P) transhydrogenase subunit beta n=1 Tax=Natronogracilivirga saccharolytica TaxID=2812953 RepID=A0A8J7RRY3_9BACT|nr:NAD(P)(+) transhydrogenase (Re/Si-specific) subunit beta [Natronogracilivirga saccharolytica]MBP3191847.1 NAD(P)(+) transhydrogenase (Re/Si-specific) subunit beta [Natronogracilivirga saccharolytica]